VRLYRDTKSGTKTISIPAHQAKACQPAMPTGLSRRNPRTASAICVIGWWSTKAWSQPGKLLDDTNALLAMS